MDHSRKLITLVVILSGALLFCLALDRPYPAAGKAGGRNSNANRRCPDIRRSLEEKERLLDRGEYLATIGVCAACHTPPAVSETPSGDPAVLEQERKFRTDPDWFAYLDPKGTGERHMSGGVPFILRFGSQPGQDGIVVTKNITPDPDTGIGLWCEDDIVRALRTGIRKNGEKLFLFPPHTFYKNLTDYDARSLAVYLQSLAPVRHVVLDRSLPFPLGNQPEVPTSLSVAPTGRTRERARYLMNALVGCKECHSYHEGGLITNKLNEFLGGDPIDPISAFRFGPDLPLRQTDKGWATFPYPGYAVLYGGNLTRFGVGGDLSHVPASDIVRAIKQGISTQLDPHGRPLPLAHVMMWQFYSSMTDDDAYAIAEFIKTLTYKKHELKEGRLTYYGADWPAAFKKVYGEAPSSNDRRIFGKP